MRKPITMIILLVYMASYVVIVATLSGTLATWPRAAQFAFYVAAGFAWIIPVRPLFRWMTAGATREDE